MAQFTKIKNVDGTIPGFFGETLYRASEVDKLEQCITFEDIVRGEG